MEVSRDHFFATVGRLNVHPQIVGNYPYTSIFKTPLGIERGRIVETLVDGNYPPVATYFVTDSR